MNETETLKEYGDFEVIGKYKTANNQYYLNCKCRYCGKEINVRKTLFAQGKRNTICKCRREAKPIKKNEFVEEGDIVRILNDGEQIAIIDADDFGRVKKHYWAKHDRYVGSYTAKMPLHRFVMQTSEMLDHKNGDTSDNRKTNLRFADCSQNAMNRKKRTDNKSGITGVNARYYKGKPHYIAEICVRHKKHSKSFNNLEAAIAQRKEWELEYFGEWKR